MNVYELLEQELIAHTSLSPEQAADVVSFLDAREVLDYDILKEVFLYPDDEDDAR
jgi:hypothetical protein